MRKRRPSPQPLLPFADEANSPPLPPEAQDECRKFLAQLLAHVINVERKEGTPHERKN
jgi:hypothetical protein